MIIIVVIINPLLLHTHISPPNEASDRPDQAVHYHILCVQGWGFISDPALGWLKNREDFYINLIIEQDSLSIT
jgi:hypothetical protein